MGTTPIAASNLRIRKSFAKNNQVIEIPNLIELQKSSYESFLQKEMDLPKRQKLEDILFSSGLVNMVMEL